MEYEMRPAETVTEAVIEAVSILEDRSPRELPPLYKSVNTDALNTIIDPIGAPTIDTQPIEVSFEYLDYCITVHNSGVIEVEELSDPARIEQ